jgi:hypothetical protein
MAILTAGQYATATIAILTLTGLIFRFVVLVPLKSYIKEQTYLIQPNSNSGKSLPDIALGIEVVKVRLEGIEKRLDTLEK